MGISSLYSWVGVYCLLAFSIHTLPGVDQIMDNVTKPGKDIWDLLREAGLNPLQSFPVAVVKRLEDLGRAESRLARILDDDIIVHTSGSRKNEFWQHPDEDVSDKLDKIRISLRCLGDNLWDVMQILRNGE